MAQQSLHTPRRPLAAPFAQLTAKKEEAQEKLDSELSRVEELKGEVAALAAERTEGVR